MISEKDNCYDLISQMNSALSKIERLYGNLIDFSKPTPFEVISDEINRLEELCLRIKE